MEKKLLKHMTAYPIINIGDVRMFIWNCVNQLKLAFDPDLPFEDYTLIGFNDTPAFTPSECERLNNTLEECHALCDREGVDIYALALEFTQQYYES